MRTFDITMSIIFYTGLIYLFAFTTVSCGKDQDAQKCNPVTQVQNYKLCHWDSYFECNICETKYSDGTIEPKCNPQIGDIK